MARVKMDGHVWNTHKIDGTCVACIKFSSGTDDATSMASGSVNLRTDEFKVGDKVRVVLEASK